MRVKGAAREIAPVHFEGRHLALAVVDAHNQILRVRRLVDIHFAEPHAALAKELLRPPAVATPRRAVNRYFAHWLGVYYLTPSYTQLDAKKTSRIRSVPREVAQILEFPSRLKNSD